MADDFPSTLFGARSNALSGGAAPLSSITHSYSDRPADDGCPELDIRAENTPHTLRWSKNWAAVPLQASNSAAYLKPNPQRSISLPRQNSRFAAPPPGLGPSRPRLLPPNEGERHGCAEVSLPRPQRLSLVTGTAPEAHVPPAAAARMYQDAATEAFAVTPSPRSWMAARKHIATGSPSAPANSQAIRALSKSRVPRTG